MTSRQELDDSELLDAVNGVGQVSAGMLGTDSASATVSGSGDVVPVDLNEESAVAKALDTKPTQVLQKLSGMCSHAKQAFLMTAPVQCKWAGAQHDALKALVPTIIQAIRGALKLSCFIPGLMIPGLIPGLVIPGLMVPGLMIPGLMIPGLIPAVMAPMLVVP